jgi:hypothetical protein
MITFRAGPIEPLENEEIYTLFANIDLIMANADKILQNEAYKNIRVKGTGIDGIYIGHINLFLGDLIRLWSNGSPWRNGQKFYYHLGGSPLSGMSFCTYWQDGKIGCDRSNPSFGTLLKPASTVIKNAEESEHIISVPLPRRQVSGLNIGDLLKYLQQ